MVTPIMIAANTTRIQMALMTHMILYKMVIHKSDTEIILALRGMALFSLKFRI